MKYSLTPCQSAAAACLLDALPGKEAAAAQGITYRAAMRRLEHLRHKLGAPSTAVLRKRLALSLHQGELA